MSQEILAGLVRRHVHDLRNYLNGSEMALTLLAETVDPNQRRDAIQRMRQEMRSAEVLLRSFSAKFSNENKSPVPLADIMDQWMVDARHLLPDAAISWEMQTANTILEIEPGILRSALGEILVLSARKNPGQPLAASCRVVNKQVLIWTTGSRPYQEADFTDFADHAVWEWLQEFAAARRGKLDRAKLDLRLMLPAAS
jgi:hypothetical protein